MIQFSDIQLITMESQTSQIENHVLKKFNILKKVGSGAYGHVWKVQDRLTKKVYALKKIFDAFQHSTDAQRTYRQIQILKQTDHSNIIKLFETIKAENNKDVYLVFQYMEADLHNVIAEGILKDVHIKFIVYQLAKALKYLHSGHIIHRDLKPSNILINSNCAIKLCDFGLVRSLIPVDDTGPVLTEGVATRWYRAPQVLLGSKSYSTPADIWSFACIIYEILAQKPLFPGNSTVDQIDKILSYTGFPTEEDIKSLQSDVAKSMLKQSKVSHSGSQGKIFFKDFPAQFADLLQKMLIFNPNKRIKIEQLLAHDVVRQFRKIQEQTQCNKEIRTSIDDNKKLTVDEYRSMIYGTRTFNKGISSSLELKNMQPKKSNSYSKIGSNLPSTQKQQPKVGEKQPLKFCRSNKQMKQIPKSLHNYNKSSEIPSFIDQNYNKQRQVETPQSQIKQGQFEQYKSPYSALKIFPQKYVDYRISSGVTTNNLQIGGASNVPIISTPNNMNSNPIISNMNPLSYQQSMVVNPVLQGTHLNPNSLGSPKYGGKPLLVKSSKYVISKTEQSNFEKQ